MAHPVAALASFARPSGEHVASFMARLETLRRAVSPDTWADVARRDPVVRRWRYFLACDPYTRWGLVKPRGYPGDATLMDFAYGHPSIAAELDAAGDLGRAIYRQTAAGPQSASARRRLTVVADELRAVCEVRERCRVVSFASGHGRELAGLDEATRRRIERFVALDHDPLALAELDRSTTGLDVACLRRDVVRDACADVGPADLVYSLGLFDALDDRHAIAVLSRMRALLRGGGRLVIANLAPDAANLAYCEAIMDWWMRPRTSLQLEQIAGEVVGYGDRVDCRQHDCFNYLTIEAPDSVRTNPWMRGRRPPSLPAHATA